MLLTSNPDIICPDQLRRGISNLAQVCPKCNEESDIFYGDIGCGECHDDTYADSWSENKRQYAKTWEAHNADPRPHATLEILCPVCGKVAEKIIYKLNHRNWKDNSNAVGCNVCVNVLEV